jgi:hypothetical protein
MNKNTLAALATAALIAGVSTASAAGTASSGARAPGPQTGILSKDTLNLSQSQRQTAWKDLYMGSLNQKTPSGFDAVAGATMPSSVVTAPATPRAVSDIPALKPYTFAMVQKKLVIVNPTDHKIAAVIRE